MEFPIISTQTLTFSEGELEREGKDFVRKATGSLKKLPNFGIGIKVCEERSDSGGINPTQENPGQLSVDLDKSLTVHITKCNGVTDGYLTISTTNSNADFYEQLKMALGGKLIVEVTFKLRTGNDELKLNEKNTEMFERYDWRKVPCPTGWVFLLSHRFHFTSSLSAIWRDNGKTFTGELSVNLILDEDHIGEILSSGEEPNQLLAANKRMRRDRNFTDATLIPGKGEGIRCHKIVLIANSDYFKKMFESKMKEGLTSTADIPDMSPDGLEALLDYLYCQDTTKASKSASLALELLMKAAEYSLDNLEKAMLQLIHANEEDWFHVGVALQLFQFARKKFKNEGALIYQFVMDKAAMVLKSKSKTEVEECKEFQEFFNNDESQMALLTYFMFCI